MRRQVETTSPVLTKVPRFFLETPRFSSELPSMSSVLLGSYGSSVPKSLGSPRFLPFNPRFSPGSCPFPSVLPRFSPGSSVLPRFSPGSPPVPRFSPGSPPVLLDTKAILSAAPDTFAKKTRKPRTASEICRKRPDNFHLGRGSALFHNLKGFQGRSTLNPNFPGD